MKKRDLVLALAVFFGVSASGCAVISYDGNKFTYARFMTDYKAKALSATKDGNVTKVTIKSVETDTEVAIKALSGIATSTVAAAAKAAAV